jgi:release factor glutamine methyltransferase
VESTRQLLTSACEQLAAAGVPTPEVDAELLLSHITGRPRALLRMAGSEVSGAQSATFAELVSQRARRIPLQHLTGLAPFRHLELRVGPGVFIPRPETELMVDHVRAFADSQAHTSLLVVDLCSGSAALALSIATELAGSRVLAVELSAAAVEWARGNIADHAAQIAAAGSSVELVEADATGVAGPAGPLRQLRGRVDVVVTNPPYVPAAAIPREPEVRDHDPDLALYGGPDGLQVVRPLADQAALLLRPGGLFLVEHADVQGEDAGESGVPAVLRSQPDPAEPDPAEPDPAEPHATSPVRTPHGSHPALARRPDTTARPAWRGVTDHLDLAGRPRHTVAIRAGGAMVP